MSTRRGRRPAAWVMAAIVSLILAAACDGSEPSARPTASPSTPTPTTATLPPASPSPSPTDAALEDGEHFGYIQSMDVEGSPQTLVFDLAEFLQGEAANEAAREDGVIGEGESVPNDYYIRNRNPRLRTLVLDDEVRITVVDWDHCCETIRGDPALFATAFGEATHTGTYRGAASPYWLTVVGGRVVAIEEQYLP
jgi:hypothetical protein